MERIRDLAARGKICQLINGLLIGLEIKTVHGHTLRLSPDTLRVLYIMQDEKGNEHPVAMWGEFVGLSEFEGILSNISEDEWTVFTANIALNQIVEGKK